MSSSSTVPNFDDSLSYVLWPEILTLKRLSGLVVSGREVTLKDVVSLLEHANQWCRTDCYSAFHVVWKTENGVDVQITLDVMAEHHQVMKSRVFILVLESDSAVWQ